MLPGEYDVLVKQTDTAGVVSTVYTGQTVTIAAPQVDLTGSFVKVPASAKAGKKFTVTFVVTNTSSANVAAVGNLPIDIETSPDGNAADAVALKPVTAHINLPPGKSVKINESVALCRRSFSW